MKTCDKNWRNCGKCTVSFETWGAYPRCENSGLWATILGNDICPNAPESDDDKSIEFGYIIKDDGTPIQILRGNTAIYYENGNRIEKTVKRITAKNWYDAVEKIKNGDC